MDTVRYRAFVTAAEKGTIKEAAEEMGYTSSAISQLIKALEEELDTELLVRSRTGVTLTSGGVTLLPVAREILAQEEKLYQTAADLNGLLTGRLTIAAYPSIATKWLPYLIQRFQDEHPGVTFALREGSWEDMYGWIEERSVDLAFIADAADTPYDWVPLATDELVAVLPLSHPMADGSLYPLSRLEEEKAIALSELGRDHEVAPRLRAQGAVWQTKFVAKEPHSVMTMVSQDMCMTITNRMNTVSWYDKVAVLPLDPPLTETIGVLAPSLEHLSPAAQYFLDLAVTRYSEREFREGLRF